MNHQWNVSFFNEEVQSVKRVNHFFRSRNHFQCTHDNFEYFNLNTGTGFTFSLIDDNNVVNLSIDLKYSNSNTIREAINEISALVKEFEFQVLYPDKNAVEEEFLSKRFIQKWHHIKRDYLDYHYDNVYYPVSTKKVKTSWYWNYSRQWTSKFLKELFAIPKISFFNLYGKAQSLAKLDLDEWAAVPEADFYLLKQNECKGLFRNTPEETRLVSRQDMDKIFSKCRFLPFEKTPFYKFRPEEFKSEIKSIFNVSEMRRVHTLEPGKIIDREIYDGKKIKALEESTY